MNFISGKSINEVVYKCIDKIVSEGYRTPSRNGDISAIYNTVVTVENPRSRHLCLHGRNSNIFAMIAETMWVFSGDDKIDPVLSFFLPRAKDFSDDGETWRGAYGARIFGNNDSFKDLIEQFKTDGIFTRRGVMSIFDPSLDTSKNLKEKYNLENTKDRPCNLMIDFFVTPDMKLHMNLKQRSGDVLWGFGSINIFEFTLLQEVVLNMLEEDYPDLTLGTYNHHVTNMHLYDFSGAQGYAVLENKLSQKFGNQNFKKVYTPSDPEDFIQFNREIVQLMSSAITEELDYSETIEKLDGIFNNFSAVSDNLYYKYAELAVAYIFNKKYNMNITVDLKGFDKEFVNSVEFSRFRKFDIITDS